MPIMSFSWTWWTGGILTGKMTFLRVECLGKVVHSIEIGILNIPTPVRMTPCPPRLQFKTSWTGGILTGKMTLLRVECLEKVVHSIETGVLNISTPVRMTPCPPRLHSRLWGWRASWYIKWHLREISAYENILTGKVTLLRDYITRLCGQGVILTGVWMLRTPVFIE